ncbi:MAG: hypothetical protein FWC00_03335 [Firmicutes bacterium]|nr:hypothetical protein [Bacillota bacterium]
MRVDKETLDKYQSIIKMGKESDAVEKYLGSDKMLEKLVDGVIGASLQRNTMGWKLYAIARVAFPGAPEEEIAQQVEDSTVNNLLHNMMELPFIEKLGDMYGHEKINAIKQNLIVKEFSSVANMRLGAVYKFHHNRHDAPDPEKYVKTVIDIHTMYEVDEYGRIDAVCDSEKLRLQMVEITDLFKEEYEKDIMDFIEVRNNKFEPILVEINKEQKLRAPKDGVTPASSLIAVDADTVGEPAE